MNRPFRAIGAVLALACVTAQAPATGNSVLRQGETRAGDWIIARYEDAGTNRLVRCEMERSYPNGSVLRVEAAPRQPIAIGFVTSGASLDRLGPRFELRFWVDDENGTQAATATALNTRSARFVEPDAEAGTLDSLAAGQDLAIMAGEMSLTYPLRGSAAAVRALQACLRR
ncbi:invasion associated locus B family protein [Sediminicoccus rosea]|jgi:hypothetical protein|uniref:Invasion protein IalB, involved in pathogenesis n=1 Tax=Sediminicoccus rosea TaxID=1225128 RepID=A0ABZ0PCP3_9PROT|nr:hypothetical protein [Sediminicoccus rosea]WPB83460.1 hypothetical protein R9Z33_15260 [Sediminicoccus rosea]